MTDVPALCFSPVFPCLVLVALSTLQTPAVLPRSRKRLVSLGAGHPSELCIVPDMTESHWAYWYIMEATTATTIPNPAATKSGTASAADTPQQEGAS